jgi:hypothetical protein
VSRDVSPQTVVTGNPATPIATLEEFTAKHRARIAGRPRYTRAGWSYGGNATAENMRRMRRELEDGAGYVE